MQATRACEKALSATCSSCATLVDYTLSEECSADEEHRGPRYRAGTADSAGGAGSAGSAVQCSAVPHWY